MGSLFGILNLLLDLVYYVVIAHVIMSWLISFQVLNIYQPIVNQIWRGLTQVLEPLYKPIRKVLPSVAGMDLTPLVVLIGIMVLRVILRNNAAYLM